MTVNAAYVKQRLRYDPETGAFTWLKSGLTKFKVETPAGTFNGQGYCNIRIGKQIYKASRLAWLYMTGEWPPSGMVIDHQNGNRADDRWSNLRLATFGQNRANSALYRNNRCGLKGVTAHKGRWRARIRQGERVVSLGGFSTPEEAHQAYLAAANRLHGKFARAR